jgi:hypothetical protein
MTSPFTHSYNTRSKSAPSLPTPSNSTSKKIVKKQQKLGLIEPQHHHSHHFSTTQLGDLMVQYDRPPTTMIATSMMDRTPPQNIMMMGGTSGAKQQQQWSSPLFSCDKLPQYVATLLCPCTAFSKIMDHLILASSEQHNRPHDPQHNSVTVQFTCQETFCSMLSYAFFPCMYLFYTNKNSHNLLMEEEEEEALCHRYLPDYIYYTPPSTNESFQSDPKAPLFLVCLASGCMIPATCFLRQIVSYKKAAKNHGKKESLWTSGIVSCLLWPCALVQVEEELYS